MSDLQAKAEKIIEEHVLWSMGAGAVPLPIVDVVSVSAVQLDMLEELCKAYEVEYSEKLASNIITAIAGSTFAKLVSSAIKAIPVLGSWLGGVSMVVLSGASTYAMGQAFVRQLETGSTLDSFDMGDLKEWFQRQFEQGVNFVNNLQGEEKVSNQSVKEAEVYEKLKILKDLREKGIVTETEFQQKKQKLLSQL